MKEGVAWVGRTVIGARIGRYGGRDGKLQDRENLKRSAERMRWPCSAERASFVAGFFRRGAFHSALASIV
jgi:hypothetical protein